jgi:gluconolactonase
MSAAVLYDDGLSELLATDEWETVGDGFRFTEGPVWHTSLGLLFSDIEGNRINRWCDGELSAFREPSGNSNGLTLDQDGRLVACEHGNRRVTRTIATEPLPIATNWEGKRLNSPNDVVVRRDGRIFFTDPPYGITEDQRELPFNGVYSIAPQGNLTLLATDFDRPNGLAFSPDQRTLYIADTSRHHVRAFAVDAEGTLTGGEVFAQMRDEGRPDGMKVDTDGRLYVCAGGVQCSRGPLAPSGSRCPPGH